MSTGISISSINRIKELAEEKKYAEALEILDTQNLDKSINPQFLRISGEIFRENKRYYDSRKILLKSHQMSPQGIRIIYELIQVYLELGYFTKAQKYYEQYMFYSTPEDTQRDYVEYIMKKANGEDVKELASILIPILERMPEDKWNFEAVLLYDKLGRKDKALEESRYILENFKDSIYINPVIEYIDDELDVDKYFYVYPREEQEEDEELFGELIAEEDKILKADYLRMYPPEPRIMVEAEDKDAVDVKPAKEKKSKKRKGKKSKKAVDNDENNGISTEEEHIEDSGATAEEVHETLLTESEHSDELRENTQKNDRDGILKEPEEEKIKREREAALEQLLSKKIDKDKIKESAKQVAKAIKDIDTTKTKQQVKSVAESVKDNVKKATDVLGEAVGTKTILNDIVHDAEDSANLSEEEQIVDGIIESVLTHPKKVVGQVVTNEELDALIPDSLEAMSAEEIADIEAKNKEAELFKTEEVEEEYGETDSDVIDEVKEGCKESEYQEAEVFKEVFDLEEDKQQEELVSNLEEDVAATIEAEAQQSLEEDVSFEELKAKFLAEVSEDEEKPLDSLGFITVVQADVDKIMEEEIPDVAGILHQMIDNKEFYTGEDSNFFESDTSYENHGFEVEDYDFETYLKEETEVLSQNEAEVLSEENVQNVPSVEIIYAQEMVVNFDEIIPEEIEDSIEDQVGKEVIKDSQTEKSDEEIIAEDSRMEIIPEEAMLVRYQEEDRQSDEVFCEADDEYIGDVEKTYIHDRDNLRVRILLSDSMIRKLLDLKESR